MDRSSIRTESAATCCWCHEHLVELLSSPGVYWCPTQKCSQDQIKWGISTERFQPGPKGREDGTYVKQRLFIPLPRQIEYLRHPARYRLAGGSAGFGKRTAGRWGLYRRALAIPGFEALILRETFPELERTHLRRMAIEADLIGASYLESKRVMKFPNGSLIEGGHMDDESAVRKYLSTEYDHILADEGASFDPQSLLEVSTRARTSKPAVLTGGGSKFDVVSNPGGRAAGMLRDLFIDHQPDADRYPRLAADYRPEEWAFIPATLDDNPYIDPGYVRALSVLQPWRYEQLRHGNWNIFAGQFFHNFNERRHVRDVPITDPKSMTWVRSHDHGFHDPTVVLWWVVLADHHVHAVAELKLTEHTVEEVIAEVKAMDRALGLPTPVSATRTYSDPSVRQRSGQTGESILETFGKNGMPLIPAVNERKNGWLRMQGLLKDAPDGIPWLTIAPECKYFIRSLSMAVSDKNDPDDIDTHSDDHALDSCFVKSTLIATEHGERPIVDLRVGEWVWTRKGLKPVVAVYTVGQRSIGTLRLSNGRTLTGTPDHKIWRESEFVRMDSLRYGDMLHGWQATTTETPAPSGASTTAPFLHTITSITRTTINRITDWTIWNACRPTTISRTIAKGVQLLRRKWRDLFETLHVGISQPLAASGIGVMRDRRWLIANPSFEFVNSVDSPLMTSRIALGSVPITASPHGVETPVLITNGENASSVTNDSSSITTARSQPVPSSAVHVVDFSLVGIDTVYNITVADAPEYYANGVLAANCRYFAMSRPAPHIRDVTPKPVAGMAGHLLDEILAAQTARPILGSGAVLHG